MKIQLRRNNSGSSSFPTSGISAGEPVWFKDRLYIGSVGSSAGGQSGKAAGDLVKVVDPVSLTLSTTSQTYITVGTDTYTLALPASDPYSSARTPASHAIDGDKHTGISVSNKANKDLLYYDSTNSVWKNGSFATIFGGTPITSYNNQTVTAKNGSATSVTTFGASAAVEIAAGSNISITTDTANSKIIIANTYSYSHPSPGTAANSYGPSADPSPAHGGTFTVPYLSFDSLGHLKSGANKIVTLPAGYSHPTRTESSSTSSKALDLTSGTASDRQVIVPTYTFDGYGHETAKDAKTYTIAQITAASLGLGDAMHFKGTVNSLPTPSTSDGYANGDVILVTGTNKEYVRSGKTSSAAGTWEELGDQGSWALKTISVTGTGELGGGGTLASDRTITHNTSGVAAGTYTSVTVNSYGHVTSGSNPGFITDYDVKTLKSSTSAQTAPGTTGIPLKGSGDVTLHKVAWTGTYSDLIGTPSIPASANDASLTVKTTSNTAPSALFSANASNAGVLFIQGGNKIGTSNSTATANSTVTNTVTIDHAAGDSAGSSKSSIGGVNSNTITVPIISTDAYGHVSSLTSTSWTYSAPASPGAGNLQLKVGTSGTAVNSGFNANSSSAVALIFNASADGGKFAVDSSTKVISITEIDGGTF